MTKTINIAEPELPLSELVSLALSGTQVVLADGDRPLVVLVPMIPGGVPRMAGLHPGAMIASDEFDAPLPDAFWLGAE